MAWSSKYKNVKPNTPLWFLIAAVASAAMLAIAHGFQTFGRLEPCELCLHQREGYWLELAVALIGYGVTRWRYTFAKPLLMLVAAVFACEAALAAYHAGVEWKWWPGPTACTGSRGAADTGKLAAGISALMRNGPHDRLVRCDEAAWRLFGLSMAGWNVLIAAALAVASVMAMRRVRTPR